MPVRDIGVSPHHSTQRVPLVLLLVRLVDVIVLLMLLVLSGVVVGDAPGHADAVGGDADGEGVVGRWCAFLRCRWRCCW